jgi:Amt family ammonium transporter
MNKTLGVMALWLLPFVARAQDASQGADTAWILTATALVLFMTLPGLALFYGGLVRSKNVLSVLLQCFAIAGVASILWFVAGYSLAFADGNAFVGGLSAATCPNRHSRCFRWRSPLSPRR